MKNTCGFYIYHKPTNTILLGHVTNNPFWSIPKGKQEEGESLYDAALRELAEESNIDRNYIKNCVVYQLMPQKYNHGKKRLNSFLAISEEIPENIKCVSTFTDSYGNELPEFDRLQWVNVDAIDKTFPIHITQYDSFLEAMEIINNQTKDK